MARILRSANPGTVVPQRVRSALDTLTEGLALISQDGTIVHSNEAFDDMVGEEGEAVLGKKLDDFGFERSESVDADAFEDEPWDESTRIKDTVRGSIRKLSGKQGLPRKFIINASPIMAEKDTVRGVLVSFDDVTALENKKNELGRMIHTLRQSRDEISRQNVELQFLANCDPLTKCYNRRSFWLKTEEIKDSVAPDQLNIIMIDIDHFKSINDTYGHSVGDDVLRDVGELLRNLVGDRGFVCRYGGEEFCIIVDGASLEGAVGIANEIRTGFHNNELGTLNITASIGVSNKALGAMDMQHMLDQADQCWYAAKRNGRDQVVRFDQCDFEMENTDDTVEDTGPTIEYSTVNGLLSALAFRSPDTAEHAIRVADLAVAIGNKLLPKKSLYRFEIAALMHDIGKIGVPDALLNKPGLLTAEEAAMMKNSRQIGLDIVSQAFACDEISEILSCHHLTYSQQQAYSSSIDGKQFPLASRIIAACDAFDSMVNKKAYRQGMTIAVAVQELKRCTPDQFDPIVVEALIAYVTQPGYANSRNFQLKTAPESAMVIGQHVEKLQSAVANSNVEQLQAALKDLKVDASASDITPITDAADKLEAAIQVRDGDELNDVIDMAEEVLALCRSTRQAVVNPVQGQTTQLTAKAMMTHHTTAGSPARSMESPATASPTRMATTMGPIMPAIDDPCMASV